jgi:hypothetical protein
MAFSGIAVPETGRACPIPPAFSSNSWKPGLSSLVATGGGQIPGLEVIELGQQ